jgi:nitroreductase
MQILKEKMLMETLKTISERRSTRKFIDKEIPVEVMETILSAAIQAPSAKNRQPWKIIVVTSKEKPAMLKAMQAGIDNKKKYKGYLPNYSQAVTGAEHTAKIMEQAPITVFVFNTDKYKPSLGRKNSDIANIQSIGAAIENMILAATDLGVGSRWICDIHFAQKELCQWLNEKGQLTASVSFGYPADAPKATERKELKDIVEWR